jgi:hypothetical protein
MSEQMSGIFSCEYCGQRTVLGGEEGLNDHLKTCPAYPKTECEIRQELEIVSLQNHIDTLRNVLERLVGEKEKDKLEEMLAFMKMMPSGIPENEVAMEAISALLSLIDFPRKDKPV